MKWNDNVIKLTALSIQTTIFVKLNENNYDYKETFQIENNCERTIMNQMTPMYIK